MGAGYPLPAPPNTIQTNKTIQKENDIKLTLRKNYSFIYTDYSNEEKEILENLKIKKNLFLTKFGNFQSLEEELKESIDEVEIISKIINKLINTVIKSFNETSAVVMIRLTKPTDNFKIPRWHFDGLYFKNRIPYVYPKFVTTLKGPSTLFYKNNQKIKKQMIKIRTETGFPPKNELQTRKKILKLMDDEKKIDIPEKYQAEVYLVGTNKYSTFHSEPDKTTDRIFIAIIPGKKKEIEELKK